MSNPLPTNQHQDELADIVAFLCGEKELDGMWFGEDYRAKGIPMFWWRGRLRKAVALTKADRERAVKAALKPTWWVTNHDAPEDNKKVSGPYVTMVDAGRAREILERFENHHNYWIEQLTPETKPEETV